MSITLLGVLLLTTGATLTNHVLTTTGITNRFPDLYFIPIYFSLSFGPLFYLFARAKWELISGWLWLHLLLPTIQFCFYLYIGFRSVDYKNWLWNSEDFRFLLSLESALFPVLTIGYIWLAYVFIRRQDGSRFFWTEDIKSWLSSFAGGLGIVALLEGVFSALEWYYSFQPIIPDWVSLLHSCILISFVMWTSYSGIKQFFPLQIFTSKPEGAGIDLLEKDAEALTRRLNKLIQEDHVYENPELNLELLAGYLGISPKRCSMFINASYKTNFNSLINQYRVEAVKEKIKQGRLKTFTVESLAYESGFDSKSTFFRVFKAHVHMTPLAFQKKWQADNL